VVCQTAHPRDFFGERDCAACRCTDSFIDVKQSTPDQKGFSCGVTRAGRQTRV
jgi:hypothetical protein